MTDLFISGLGLGVGFAIGSFVVNCTFGFVKRALKGVDQYE